MAELPLAFLGEGFGFNGNILSTNIINLAVVLGVVISFGGDALRSLLENRRQTIQTNLEQADKKAEEAEERLTKVKDRLERSQQAAKDILAQGRLTADQEKKRSLEETRNDIARLEQTKEETIQLQQQKAIAQVSKQVVGLAFQQVKSKLSPPLDKTIHASVNDFNIVLFGEYRPSMTN
uniref:ATP synthase subunit b, chloroplastic n=1 Tax=Symbiochloris handae TaxID=1853882 RepID=A0A097KJE1_9CHLO|nr:CF0 subunit I of ATP synthase [Symbiochloris handae]AIT93307.1 CF0 subunit I of ATP synthase [Symbiochloris handae]